MTVLVKKNRPFQSRSGWTPQRRRAQAARLRAARPWLRSTGPRTAAGKAVSAQNGVRHGARSEEMARVNRALRAQRQFMLLLNKGCRARGRYRRSCGDPALRPLNINPLLQRLHHYFMREAAAILRDHSLLYPHGLKVKFLLEIPLKFGFMSGLRVSADVAELVDALDLGSSAARRGGSSPFIRTTV
ncbi:MAG: hypothetical protein JWO78_1067 [Micavibrio sp.]|nr:hypothetical protein [Micavibrio sp.]